MTTHMLMAMHMQEEGHGYAYGHMLKEGLQTSRQRGGCALSGVGWSATVIALYTHKRCAQASARAPPPTPTSVP